MERQIITTADGSSTIHLPEWDEQYHSKHGAIQEAYHVFIKHGLHHFFNSQPVRGSNEKTTILEIGFGTGLNAFITLLEAEKNSRKIDFTSLELYPVSITDAEKLNYAELIDPTRKEVFNELHKTGWGKWNQVALYFSLLKMKFDFSKPTDFCPENQFDVIFFDAFAPEKQPEMWTQEIFDKIYSVSSENAILTTYCAKGVVRRMLQAAGFVVERMPGPPGKREILRARK